MVEREIRQLELHAERARVVQPAASIRKRPLRVEGPKLSGQLARNVVVCQVDDLDIVEAADLRRDGALEAVPRQVEVRQVLQVAELRRQVAFERVVLQ